MNCGWDSDPNHSLRIPNHKSQSPNHNAMITIAHIIFYGSESIIVDMAGMTTDLAFERSGGDLSLINIDDAVTMRGNAGGVLTLSGDGQIDLTGIVFCRNLNRNDFTGTLNLNGFWFDYSSGTVFWVFATTTNVIETWRIKGGIA